MNPEIEPVEIMSAGKALKILHAMQKWRRGGGPDVPYSGKEYGLALDTAIRTLREKVREDRKVKKQKG